MVVPRANVGSCGIFTPFPPTTGTQSGILMLLSPAIAPLIIPIMLLITPFTMLVRASHAPENTLFIPSQACPQLPEKTPVINWIRPDRTVARPFTTPPMVLNTFWKIASTDGTMEIEEMAQQSRTLTVLPEVLSSIPSNYMVDHNHL